MTAFAHKSWSIIMTSIVIWDLPSYILVITFSFFTFYLAKLNIEVEKINLHLKDGMQEQMY
jgi:hypothetical protein